MRIGTRARTADRSFRMKRLVVVPWSRARLTGCAAPAERGERVAGLSLVRPADRQVLLIGLDRAFLVSAPQAAFARGAAQPAQVARVRRAAEIQPADAVV